MYVNVHLPPIIMNVITTIDRPTMIANTMYNNSPLVLVGITLTANKINYDL